MSQHKDFWTIITSRLFLLVAAVAIIAIGVGMTNGLMRQSELQQEIAKLQNDINSFQNKNNQLNDLIQYLGTPEFKEREARLRLSLQKPGENVVVIPNLSNQILDQSNNSALTIDQSSNWQKWINYFFGKK